MDNRPPSDYSAHNPDAPHGYDPVDDNHYPASTERDLLHTEEARLAAAQHQATVNRAVEIVYYIVGALLVLLLIRFFLRLSGANPDNTFAEFIYNFSDFFVSPFSTLFISPTIGQSIIDVNLMVAMIVYAILGWLVGRLIRLVWS